MEDNPDSYQKALLKAFRRHGTKFTKFNTSYFLQSYNEKRENPQLKNYREFFETGFLRVLSRSDLDDIDIQLLPHHKAQKLFTKLGDLFGLLDEIINDSFEPVPTISASSRGPFQINGSYPKLDKLLSSLDKSEGPFDLATGTSSSIFKINTLACGLACRSIVRELNHILDSIQHASRKKFLVVPDTTASNTIAADHWIQSFDREYREFAGKVLDAIRTEFAECESKGCNSPHEVRVQLLDIAVSDLHGSGADLDVFLLCPSAKSKTWLNTRCKLNRENQSGGSRSRTLCQIIKSSIRRGECLVLQFEEVLPCFSPASSTFDLPTIDFSKYPMLNLKNLITVRRVFNLPSSESEQKDLFNHPERRALAAKLALNLLIFCSWRHTSTPWDSDGIYFLGSSTEDYDRKSTYISCLLGHDSTTVFQASDDDAPIQCFTEFAKLLLEIEYGLLPNGNFGADNDHGWKIIRDFHKSKQSWGDLSRQKYLEAVDACLRFDQLYQTARNKRSGRLETIEETYKKLIRTNIVCNIVADLPGIQNPSPKRAKHNIFLSEKKEQVSDSDYDSGDDYLATVTGNDDYFDNGNIESFSTNGQAKKEVAVHGLELICSQPEQGTSSSKKVSFQEAPQNNFGSLFDAQSDFQPPSTAKSAESWFNTLDKKVRPIMCKLRRTKDRVVKVAVLDTGIDSTHEKIKEHLAWNGSRIAECKDWTASTNSVRDCVGHGTAVCDVLLRVAKVDLFVGKVSDSAEFGCLVSSRVAQAIEHAASVSGWDVDIIVLSLGFEQEDDAIRCAILSAFTKNKIIFAAASNSGSIIPNKRVSYPARIHGQVLSIRSASGESVRSSASPKPSDGEDNYMTLGEGIKAAWPPDLNEGLTRYVSGSSFATPLAAGIACLALEFSIQKGKGGPNIPSEIKTILWTYRGIRKIFQYMSAIDDQSINVDCKMIYPWKLFDPDWDYEGYGLEIKKLMKSV